MYTDVLDLLALLGGLALIMHTMVTLVISLWNEYAMENWLVSNLFKSKMPASEDKSSYASQPRKQSIIGIEPNG